jgi:hypothetical protein
MRFLEDQLPLTTDVYELAIIAYVLNLGASPRAREALDKLQTLSTTEGIYFQIIILIIIIMIHFV